MTKIKNFGASTLLATVVLFCAFLTAYSASTAATTAKIPSTGDKTDNNSTTSASAVPKVTSPPPHSSTVPPPNVTSSSAPSQAAVPAKSSTPANATSEAAPKGNVSIPVNVTAPTVNPTEPCEWVGSAPFCFGECREGFEKLMEASEAPTQTGSFQFIVPEFGLACLTGYKDLCCPKGSASGILIEAKHEAEEILARAQETLDKIGGKAQ